MKLFAVIFIAIVASSPLSFAAPVDSEYLCDDCNGYLTLKKMKNQSYELWLGVGGGSCGGDVFVMGNFQLSTSNTFSIPRKQKNRKCTTKVEIDGDKAYVSDSCVKPEDEANSTCAIMGEYTRRAK